jgi:hypothetical protein
LVRALGNPSRDEAVPVMSGPLSGDARARLIVLAPRNAVRTWRRTSPSKYCFHSALNFLPAKPDEDRSGPPLPGASPVDRDVGFTPTVNRV